jgi:hypothetical protein
MELLLRDWEWESERFLKTYGNGINQRVGAHDWIEDQTEGDYSLEMGVRYPL